MNEDEDEDQIPESDENKPAPSDKEEGTGVVPDSHVSRS